MMEQKFICPICGNSDPKYIGYLNDKPYCRACINFKGKKPKPFKIFNQNIKLTIDYHLSKKQEEIANKVLANFKNKKDSLIYAVTGAGKTELVFYTIEYALQHNMSVGFAVPRKDVVIDLYPRFTSAFPKAKVIYIIQNHSQELNGDITLLTTHQLYRFTNYFDLLIIDEIDAFPYKDNQVLNSFAKSSCKRNMILMSATPSKKDIEFYKKNGQVFEMFERYHHHKLIVPKLTICYLSLLGKLILTMKEFIKLKYPLFVFVPTILLGQEIFPIIKKIYPNGELVHSEKENREEIIANFKKGKLDYLVTTSILERGVTCKNLQVIVYNADNKLYSKEILIQISGRVGRKKQAPNGKVIFLAKKPKKEINQAIYEINRLNEKSGL